MQDHYEGPINFHAQVPWPLNIFEGCRFDPEAKPSEDPALEKWLSGKGGPYAQGSAPLAFSFRSSVSETEDADVVFFGLTHGHFRGFFPGMTQDPPDPSAIVFVCVKTQIKNDVGTVILRSSDPREAPIINFNYFEKNEENDLKAMTEATEKLIEIVNSVGEPYTPCEVVYPVPGRSISQGIMDNSFGHHASSSCRMGPKDDPGSCVDGKLRVNGVDGLRVVDGSVFPHPPGAFPAAAMFMLSQKAFKDIINEL